MQVSAGNVFWRLSNVPLLHITCHHHLATSISSPHSCLWIFNMNLTSSSLPSSPATVKTDIGRNFGQIFFIFFYFFPIRSKVQILCTLQGEESPCRASWQQHMLISDFCLCIQYTWELHPLCSSPNPSHRFSQVCVPTVPGSRNTDSTVQCTNIFNNLSVCQCTHSCRLQTAFPIANCYGTPLFLASLNELLHIMWWQEMQRHLKWKHGGHEEGLLLP